MAISILCVSIKRIKDWDEPKDDLGFNLKQEPKEAWLVKFSSELGGKKLKMALTYDTEIEARKWNEGSNYSPQEWAQKAGIL